MADNDRHNLDLPGAFALEHLTGPARGTLAWLSGPVLVVTLSGNRMLRLSRTEPSDTSRKVLARFQIADGSYRVTAAEEPSSIWVNGNRVESRVLRHGDMVEFGDHGPLSRFCVYEENWRGRKMPADILRDVVTYLRVSRQPFGMRLFRAATAMLRRLSRETTILFRLVTVLAVVGLVVVAYQQSRLNDLLQTEIERGASRMDDFAGILSRAREEALTPADLESLQQELSRQLSSNVERLETLEQRSEANARVIAQSMPSVVFVQGGYGYRDTDSGRMMRHVVDNLGRPLISPMGQPMLSLDGEGPVAERQYTGTAFLVGEEGAMVTNRHVALPWEGDGNMEALEREGLEPVMTKSLAYAPGSSHAYDVELVRASDDADLAVMRLIAPGERMAGLVFADALPVPGNEIIVMGYPTGLRSMLAQSGGDFIEELQEAADTGFWSVAARLAEGGYIAPLSSRGIVSQATPATIVYDAETTHGGSGGPVLDTNGRVIAVNAAILPEYGGSNLGIPIDKVRSLLNEAGF